ncbi:MAG: FAD-dependent oxidoreductase [Chloroflexota bacterium]
MLAEQDTRWHKTADVVVIGYGMAGAVAAITASDGGASVLVLEKQDPESHCSCSSLSAGLVLCPSDVDAAAEYMTALCQADEGLSWTDGDIIRAWAEYTAQNRNWLEELGGNISFYCQAAEYPHLPGADSIQVWHYQGSGLRMMQFLYQQVSARRMEVLYRAPARRLLTDEHGAVIGVRAAVMRDGREEEVNIRATRAVIMCSGGFEASEEMKLQYLRVYPAFFTGGAANTGDGIRMAQEAGADLWHMSCCSARLSAKFPEFPSAFMIDFGGLRWKQLHAATQEPKAGFIIVNRHGRRYLNENLRSHSAIYELTAFDTHRLEYYAVPSYHIFDRRRMECGPLTSTWSGQAGPQQFYKWSQDNMAEVQRGWILSATTVAGLADKIGVPAPALEDEVSRWNAYCRKGIDAGFGRKQADLIPLDSPPFYAVRLYPGGPNTQGGPRRNSRAQVVNPFGQPISRLYAAGECGSLYGMLYPMAGGNLAECIAFGRIAAENALREG